MLTASQSSTVHHVAPVWSLEDDFEALYDAHAGFVWANLRRLGVPAADVEDAVQEVFVTAFRRADALRADASTRGWLFGILRRVAFRHRRGNERRARLHQALTVASPPSPDPSSAHEGREAAALVERFLDRLDRGKREVFVLAELEQMSGREISAALGVNANTVSSRLRAARHAFDRHFERLRASEQRAVQGARGALQRARREHHPRREAKARVLGAIAASLSTGPAGTVGLGLSGLSTAAFAQLKVFAVTVAVGLVGLAAIGVATRPAQRDATPPHSTGSAALPPDPADSSAAAAVPAVAPSDGAAPPEAAPLPRPEPASAFEVSPRPREGARTRPVASTRAAAGTSASPSTLAAEAALLRNIRAARDRGDAARALRLADQHARQFPAGVLVAERRALRITALCSLGRERAAVREANALLQEHPDAPMARRVAAGCPHENR